MLPATVAMSPAAPVGVAARALVRTPPPVPAAMSPATTVARPRRAGNARRLSDCRNIGSSWRCEARGMGSRIRQGGAPKGAMGDYSAGLVDPFRVEGFLTGG